MKIGKTRMVVVLLLTALSSMQVMAADLPDATISSSYNFFGRSIAYADPWLVVGASADMDTANNRGKVLIYRKTANGPAQLVETLTPEQLGFSGETQMEFGYSLAITRRNDYFLLAVGAPGQSNSAGGVHIYSGTEAGVWQHEDSFNRAETPGERFGHSVDVDYDRLIVGAPHDKLFDTKSGAVYIYDSSHAGPDPQYVLYKWISGDTADEYCGWSVALGYVNQSQGYFTYAVACPNYLNKGRVKLFVEEDDPVAEPDTFQYAHTIHSTHSSGYPFFGGSIDMDGELLIAGEPGFDGQFVNMGSASIFELSVNRDIGDPNDPNDDKLDTDSSRVALWTAFDGNTGQDSVAQRDAQFGYSVAIRKGFDGASNFVALSGMPFMDRDGWSNRGAAFVFDSYYGDWDFWQISSGYGSSHQWEGYAVAINDNWMDSNQEIITAAPLAKKIHVYRAPRLR